MYEAYWKLSDNPFHPKDGAESYFASETHQAALLKLRYVIEHRKGLACVIGPNGAGKSFLARTIAAQPGEASGPAVHVTWPRMNVPELLAYIAREWGVENLGEDPVPVDRLISALRKRMGEFAEAGQHPVLLVDDAHLIESTDLLQALRQVVHLRGRGEADCTVILLGQSDLLPRLRRIADLDDRIAVKCLLRPLNPAETQGYVESRMAAVGRDDTNPVFMGDAYSAIHERSGGLPRRINRVCDLALLVGYADDLPRIDANHIEAVAEELDAVIAE